MVHDKRSKSRSPGARRGDRHAGAGTSRPKRWEFKPDHMPRFERILYTVLAVALVIYAVYGVGRGDLFVPGKHGRHLHLRGASAWLMLGAAVLAGASLLSEVASHYDKRDNERDYRRLVTRSRRLALGCLILSVLVHLYG